MLDAHTSDAAAPLLAELVYELLDAHADTEALLVETGSAEAPPWQAHRAYLRDLQRVGRELLAGAVPTEERAAIPLRWSRRP